MKTQIKKDNMTPLMMINKMELKMNTYERRIQVAESQKKTPEGASHKNVRPPTLLHSSFLS